MILLRICSTKDCNRALAMDGCDMDEADCAILEPRVRGVELFKGLKN